MRSTIYTTDQPSEGICTRIRFILYTTRQFVFTDTPLGWNIFKASGTHADTWTLPTSKLLPIVDLISKHVQRETAETCMEHKGACMYQHHV